MVNNENSTSTNKQGSRTRNQAARANQHEHASSGSFVNARDRRSSSFPITTTLTASALEKSILDNVRCVLDERLDALKTSIIAEVNKTFLALNQEIAELRAKVSKLECTIASSTESHNELSRLQRSSDLIISGVPESQSEDVLNTYKQIAKLINVDVSSYAKAFRLKRKSKKSSAVASSSPILVKLSCAAERDSFFDAVRIRKAPFLLKDLNCGFMSDTPISIYESLAPLDRDIKHEALRRRRISGVPASIMIKNNAVFIRLNNDSRPVKVISIEQLKQLIPVPEASH